MPPTATATPEVLGCDPGLLRGGFGNLYRENVAVRQQLGCPTSAEIAGSASEQFFEQGMMYWWGLNNTAYRDTIFILFGRSAGTYAIFPPEEVAAMPEPPPSDDPTAPKNGFGRIYYNRDSVANQLGRWTSAEIELKNERAGVIQFFDRGLMLYTPDDRPRGEAAIFVLYDDLTFERYIDTFGG
ncbi:MAG: hypothetical protein HC822_18050 [Oscillochloris sp.]|nr:hypothetical protein [Oscillochloris sp.]